MSDEFLPLLTKIAASSNTRIKLRFENYSYNMGVKFFKICKHKLCDEENSIKGLQDKYHQLEELKAKLQTNLARANQAVVMNKQYSLLLEEKLQSILNENNEILLKGEARIAQYQQAYKNLASRYEGQFLAVERKNLQIAKEMNLMQFNKIENGHKYYKSRLQIVKEEHKNKPQQQIIQLAYYMRHKREIEILKQSIKEIRLKHISLLTSNTTASAGSSVQDNVTNFAKNKNVLLSEAETAVDLSQCEADIKNVTSLISEKPTIAEKDAVLEIFEKENVEINVDPSFITAESLAEKENIETGINTSNDDAIVIEDHDNINKSSVEISDPHNQETVEVEENSKVMELKDPHIREDVTLSVEQAAEIVRNLDGEGTIVTHIGMDIETPLKGLDINKESEADIEIFNGPANQEDKENETVSKFFGKKGDDMEANCPIKKPKLDLNYQIGEQGGKYITAMEKELQCFDTQSSYPENTLGSPISDISSNIDGKYLTNFSTISSPEPEKSKDKVEDVGPTSNFESLFTGHSFRKPSTSGHFDFQSQYSNKSDNTPLPFFHQQNSDAQKEPNNKFKNFFLF